MGEEQVGAGWGVGSLSVQYVDLILMGLFCAIPSVLQKMQKIILDYFNS